MSAPAELQSSVHSASELIECNYMLSPKEPCQPPVTDIQINGNVLAGYTQCRCRSGYTRHLLSYWPSLWVTAEIWSVMWQNKSVSQRLLARSRGGVHYNWFYRCPSIPRVCVRARMSVSADAGMVGGHRDSRIKKRKKGQNAQRKTPECLCVYKTAVMCVPVLLRSVLSRQHWQQVLFACFTRLRVLTVFFQGGRRDLKQQR